MHSVFAGRAAEIGMSDWTYRDTPVQFWDLFGEQGHPIRATVSEMGPLLLSRLMNLNEVQEGVLTIAFTVADKDGLLLLDLDDLQSLLVHVGERADALTLEYGNVSKQSVGAIQRSLLQLKSQGGEHFFGEPALDLEDFFATDEQGRGVVNILAADRLMASPRLYATFLLWMLSEMFELLGEVGDPDKPKLCFFFDEAHLLFDDAPPGLLEKVEQVVRLIRSKGVGVYFITQNPIDIPDKVAAQLNNRVQHKLNAFTPRDQQAVKAAADTFRINPDIDVATAITELKIGEALVSMLQPDGAPSPVQRTLVKPPSSRVGPAVARGTQGDHDDRRDRREIRPGDGPRQCRRNAQGQVRRSRRRDRRRQGQVRGRQGRGRKSPRRMPSLAKEQARAATAQARLDTQAKSEADREAARQAREAAKPSMTDKIITSATRSAASSIGRSIGNQILRGILGGFMKGGR